MRFDDMILEWFGILNQELTGGCLLMYHLLSFAFVGIHLLKSSFTLENYFSIVFLLLRRILKWIPASIPFSQGQCLGGSSRRWPWYIYSYFCKHLSMFLNNMTACIVTIVNTPNFITLYHEWLFNIIQM